MNSCIPSTKVTITDMRIKDLKNIISNLPDDMLVIIPVIDEDNCDCIYAFRRVRTAGVLVSDGEKDRKAFCINTTSSNGGQDIADQVYFSGKDVGVEEVLFGTSKHDNKVGM